MTTPELDKAYEPAATEAALYARWEGSGAFHRKPDDEGEPYAIVIPPPNVTGSLHIGHALDNTIQDALIRKARMDGRNAVWLPGTDHAGIATQAVVERQLADEGIARVELGREAFVDRVWEWREQYGGKILHQLRRLGAACDWDREAFTFDEPRSQAVRKVFCDLYEAGLIYRGLRLINWDPTVQTALSDIEVDHVEIDGELTSFRYPAADGGDGVIVATTRPETMLGDTAIAVHPEDERYTALVGSTVRHPFLDREIPVVADAHVDPEFGSGAVKVTPAHDPNDYAIAERHDLEIIDVMTDDGRINDAGARFAGMDRFAAREAVIAALDEAGLLIERKAYTHSVGHSSRSGAPVEPRLSEQWFVKVRPLADAAAAAVREGRTAFVPERNAKGFLDWLDNLHDWCISRQIWWGHRIPAWYDADGEIHVLREDPTDDLIADLGLVRRDEDVLDTWFSSQLWPLVTLGWPEQTPELERWYPTSVLVTGYDINTFWVSRMLMICVWITGEVPFGTVLNHGMVRDKHGKKMGKSFGNVIDPLEFIDRYGADALRFALLRAAVLGQDVPLAEDWVEGARRFANKLWNAARFTIGRIDGAPVPAADADLPAPEDLALEDRWILSRLEAVRAEVDIAWEGHDLARCARVLYHFAWDELCDWYLELAKVRDDAAARAVLGWTLDQTLRMLHPLVPFVTDTLWRALHGHGGDEFLINAAWPSAAPHRLDPDAEDAFAALVEVVTELRRFRADHGLSPKRTIDVVAVAEGPHVPRMEAAAAAIRSLAGVADWRLGDGPPSDGPVGKISVTSAELYVPLAGLIDLDEERSRLEKELAKAEAEQARAEQKLGNERFVANAPDDVVQAERDKLAEWTTATERLREQLAVWSG